MKVIYLLPEAIVLDETLNGRYQRNNPELKTAVAAMAADIEARGQDTPVKLRKNDNGDHVLVFGYCRYHAVKMINDKLRKQGAKEDELVNLAGIYETLTEEESLIAAIGENRFRVGTTPMDDCWNITILRKKWKRTDEEIALRYFPNSKTGEKKATAVKWVRDRAALAELHVDVQEAVISGEIKVTTAKAIAKIKSKADQKAVLDEAETVKGKKRVKVATVLAKGKGKTAERAKAQVQAAKDKKAGIKKPATPAPAAAKPVAKTGSVYAAAEGLASAVEVWLEDATKQAEEKLVAAIKAYREFVPKQAA